MILATAEAMISLRMLGVLEGLIDTPSDHYCSIPLPKMALIC